MENQKEPFIIPYSTFYQHGVHHTRRMMEQMNGLRWDETNVKRRLFAPTAVWDKNKAANYSVPFV